MSWCQIELKSPVQREPQVSGFQKSGWNWALRATVNILNPDMKLDLIWEAGFLQNMIHIHHRTRKEPSQYDMIIKQNQTTIKCISEVLPVPGLKGLYLSEMVSFKGRFKDWTVELDESRWFTSSVRLQFFRLEATLCPAELKVWDTWGKLRFN